MAMCRAAVGRAANSSGVRLGGLGLYLHRHFGCEVLGVSLSPDQVARQ